MAYFLRSLPSFGIYFSRLCCGQAATRPLVLLARIITPARIGVSTYSQVSRGIPPRFGSPVLVEVRTSRIFLRRFMAQRLYPKACRTEDAMSSIARVYSGKKRRPESRAEFKCSDRLKLLQRRGIPIPCLACSTGSIDNTLPVR